MPRVGHSRVNLGLLVLRAVEGHVVGEAVLLHRLTQARHVAVALDAPHPRDEAVLVTVKLGMLNRQKPNQGLRNR